MSGTTPDLEAPAQWFPISELEPWAANPKIHDKKQITKLRHSIIRHGWGAPILAHAPTRRIMAGHGRTLALKSLIKSKPDHVLPGAPGPGMVPVRWFDGPWSRCVELALADNRIAEDSRDDLQALARVLRELDSEEDLARRVVGYEAEEMAAMMGAIAPTTRKPPKPRAGGIVRPPEDPDSVRGKVYECGPHLVVCGDSLDLELLGMVVTPGSVGLMVLDPPYAIFGSATGVSSSVADDKMIRPMFERTCAAINQTLRTFGQAYICCDWRSVATIMEAARGFGQLEHVNTLIWDKQQGGLGSNWGNSYEELVYLMKRPPARTMKSSTKDTGVRMIGQSNVLRHTRPQGYDRLHNAAKSVPLFEQVIEAATDPGDLVVDLFGGSGTTMIAAANLGRRAVVFELDRGWCDVIRMRWRMYAEEHGYEPGAGALAGELTRASSSD